MQVCRYGGKRRWKSREQNYNDQNQPNVICFRDWRNGACNELALCPRSRTRGQQVPDAGSEVRAAAQRVKYQTGQNRTGRKELRGEPHGILDQACLERLKYGATSPMQPIWQAEDRAL